MLFAAISGDENVSASGGDCIELPVARFARALVKGYREGVIAASERPESSRARIANWSASGKPAMRDRKAAARLSVRGNAESGNALINA